MKSHTQTETQMDNINQDDEIQENQSSNCLAFVRLNEEIYFELIGSIPFFKG